MQDRACRHGYVGECVVCADAALIRAMRVAEHYANPPNRNAAGPYVRSMRSRTVGDIVQDPAAEKELRKRLESMSREFFLIQPENSYDKRIADKARELVKHRRALHRDRTGIAAMDARKCTEELESLVHEEARELKSYEAKFSTYCPPLPGAVTRGPVAWADAVAHPAAQIAPCTYANGMSQHSAECASVYGRTTKCHDRLKAEAVGAYKFGTITNDTREGQPSGGRRVQHRFGPALHLWIGAEEIIVKVDRHTTAGHILESIKRLRPSDYMSWYKLLDQVK
jgi:hypothetical protein